MGQERPEQHKGSDEMTVIVLRYSDTKKVYGIVYQIPPVSDKGLGMPANLKRMKSVE